MNGMPVSSFFFPLFFFLNKCLYGLVRPARGSEYDAGWIVDALLSKARGKPHTNVARGSGRLELSKGCLCICVWETKRNSNYGVLLGKNGSLACKTLIEEAFEDKAYMNL